MSRTAVSAGLGGHVAYVRGWPSVVNRIVWYLDAVVTVLLAVQLGLVMLGANATSFFERLMYGATAPLVWPFLKLFYSRTVDGMSSVAMLTLVAIVIYFMVAWGLSTLVNITLHGHRVTIRPTTLS